MTEEVVERNARCQLIHTLKRLQGQENVVLRTVGGFQFDAGRIIRICDNLASATDVEVQLPGGDSIALGNITINLCALYAVGVDS
ncbi:MAG: hypothetical protein E6X17_12305 [Sporomusaceae bacterium]|nr:hypothetical protein [Sporomusaceae bacterium]